MQTKYTKYIIFCLILISISAFFLLGIDRYFTVESVRIIKSDITSYNLSNSSLTVLIFVLIYITGTSISLPIAGIMSITGGALFGLVWGTILVSISGTLGATLSFLLSRYLFRDYIQRRYSNNLTKINEGINNKGNVYLLTLRLVPVIPFFIINPVMGITPMPVFTYSLITLIGTLPLTSILVNGGVQIANINSIQDILSFKVLFSFLLIGLIPLIIDKLSRRIKLDQ